MAEEEAEKPKEMIKLVSKEGHEFSVEKQAAMVSNTIKSMLTGPGAPLRLLSPPAARRRGAAQGARGARGLARQMRNCVHLLPRLASSPAANCPLDREILAHLEASILAQRLELVVGLFHFALLVYVLAEILVVLGILDAVQQLELIFAPRE